MAENQMRTLQRVFEFLFLFCVGCTGTFGELLAENEKAKPDFKVVGQCFNQASPFSFVSLYCGYNQVIEIRQAFHGSHKNLHIRHCSLLPQDCTMDTTHMYNWAKCEGRHSCVQVMKVKDMPKCDSGTMQYLQVEYTCIESAVTTPAAFIPTAAPKTTKVKPHGNEIVKSYSTQEKKKSTPGPEPELLEDLNPETICTNHTERTTGATVISPGFPTHYLSDIDCRCIVQAEDGAKVSITYQDLGLVMRGKECVDWLLIQSLGHKVPAAVTCGQLKGESRTLVTRGNWALLHFHTATSGSDQQQGGDTEDSKTQMKKVLPGFRINIRSQPEGDFKMQCYTTHPSVLSSLRYKNGKHDATDNLILPASDLETMGTSDSLSSPSKNGSSKARLSVRVMVVFLYMLFRALFNCT